MRKITNGWFWTGVIGGLEVLLERAMPDVTAELVKIASTSPLVLMNVVIQVFLLVWWFGGWAVLVIGLYKWFGSLLQL
jgi:hypothetical protein